MTHDELLARIDLQEARWSDERTHKALRAVVELHRPMWWSNDNSSLEDANCFGCDDRCGCNEGDFGGLNRWITCPTIQAIEKELNNG